MVLAWSITEIIRYSFYAANLLTYEPRWLLWLRYNTFFVLYPLGAGSEAALLFATLPSSVPPLLGSSWTQKAWTSWDYVRGILFLVWWPGMHVPPAALPHSEPSFFARLVHYVYLHDSAASEGLWKQHSYPRPSGNKEDKSQLAEIYCYRPCACISRFLWLGSIIMFDPLTT